MEEMLPEIRVKKSARATMTGALHTLKALFESLPSKAMREVPFAPPCLGRLALSVAQAPCSLNGRAVLSRSRPASRRDSGSPAAACARFLPQGDSRMAVGWCWRTGE